METRRSLVVHLVVVSLLGSVSLAVLAHRTIASGIPFGTEMAVMVLLVAVGELCPVVIPRRAETDQVTTSTIFTFALLLRFGMGPAAIVQAGASLLADVVNRKAWWKTVFNAAQYTLSVQAAGLVLDASGWSGHGATDGLGAANLPAIVLAAAAFFLANNLLTGVALGLALRERLIGYLLDDLAFQASTAGVLFALSPLVLLAADRDPLLIFLVAFPMAAVYRSTSVSLEKEHQSLHDSLTNLPNRLLFRERLASAIAERRSEQCSCAVMVMDLDGFKTVNDTLGHHVGDVLLRQVARRIESVLSDTDTIARLGGDEFGVLLPVLGAPRDVDGVAARILDCLDEPFAFDGFTLQVSASIGIAVSPGDGDNIDTLIQRADIAMYVAKARSSGFEHYTTERDENSHRRLRLLGEMREALERGDFFVVFQPKAELETGQVSGVEALLRWGHPALGPIPPDEFIPLAEQSGLIGAITDFVLREALAQVKRWELEGLDLGVAVNLSVKSLHDDELPMRVWELLRRSGVPASLLELEVTETAIMADAEQAMHVAESLSDIGVRITIDDFGTGYSSLAYLRRLPVTAVKIDRSFVRSMRTDANDEAIVRSIVDLGHSLGLLVIAEGVEAEEDWETLAAIGCDQAQGYFLAKPARPSDLAPVLHELGRRRQIPEPERRAGIAPVEERAVRC